MSDVSEDLRRIQRAATAQTGPNLKTAVELNPGEWCRAAGEWFVVESVTEKGDLVLRPEHHGGPLFYAVSKDERFVWHEGSF